MFNLQLGHFPPQEIFPDIVTIVSRFTLLKLKKKSNLCLYIMSNVCVPNEGEITLIPFCGSHYRYNDHNRFTS